MYTILPTGRQRTRHSIQPRKNAHNRAETHNRAQCTQPSIHKQTVFPLAKQALLLLFMIDQMIWKLIWGQSHTANCAFKSDMCCKPGICLKNNRLYLRLRRPCSLKWWHTTKHQRAVVCCTMFGCVQVGSVVWRVTRGNWPHNIVHGSELWPYDK